MFWTTICQFAHMFDICECKSWTRQYEITYSVSLHPCILHMIEEVCSMLHHNFSHTHHLEKKQILVLPNSISNPFWNKCLVPNFIHFCAPDSEPNVKNYWTKSKTKYFGPDFRLLLQTPTCWRDQSFSIWNFWM